MTFKSILFSLLALLPALLRSSTAFVIPPSLTHPASQSLTTHQRSPVAPFNPHQTTKSLPFARQRKSVAHVQTMGLFGLGAGELVLILVVVAFVLGPQNIGRIAGSTFDRADAIKDELMKVPDEFKKGVEEGESTARARNARPIRRVVDDKED
jgi:Sec-independent protein translocase protein TatA